MLMVESHQDAEGGHKRLYRVIDFRRTQIDKPSKVIALEYDPNRTAHLALLEFEDGENYILAPQVLMLVIRFWF